MCSLRLKTRAQGGIRSRGVHVPALLHDKVGRPWHGTRRVPINRRSPTAGACGSRRVRRMAPMSASLFRCRQSASGSSPSAQCRIEFRVGSSISGPPRARSCGMVVPLVSFTSTPDVRIVLERPFAGGWRARRRFTRRLCADRCGVRYLRCRSGGCRYRTAHGQRTETIRAPRLDNGAEALNFSEIILRVIISTPFLTPRGV